jgi:hypothetical protein
VRFTTLAANEDVAALARRLYHPPTAQAQRDAEAALLRANPALADASARTPGAILIVPDVAGATPTGEARSEGQLVVPILQAARDQLSAVAATLRGSVDDRRATVRATIDQVGSARIRDLVSDDPDLQAAINDVASQAGTESGEIDALDALQQQAIAELGQDLDDLIRSVGGQPSPPPPSAPPASPTPSGPTPGPAPSPAPPSPAQPAPTQPGPVRPIPTQPAPASVPPIATPPVATQPTPTQPVPTQPSPTVPTPTQPPRPTQPAPAPSTPVPTSPTVPSPAPAPTQPAPTQPTPTRPTQPGPVQPVPAQPSPVTPTPAPTPGPARPIAATPVQPGTVTPTSVQPRTPPASPTRTTPIAKRGKGKSRRPPS